MKTAAVIIVGFIFFGCSSPTSDKALESKATVAAFVAVQSTLEQRPEFERMFKIAFDHIKHRENAEAITPMDIIDVFNILHVKEFRTGSILVFPAGSKIVIQEDLGMMEVVEDPEKLRGIMRGIGQAIQLARPEWKPMEWPPLPFGTNALYNERSRKAGRDEVK